ncbi:MAG: cytochrome d ubiquinol oxidase subunit II, partial [Streptococcus salivarius]|nr:cytochrome d ubiquinol oxidase subunit II [Streptococcus salivarius]
MHLSLALLVLLFSLILSNVINRVFPRLPLPLIQIIFGVGIGFLFKESAFELETELFLAFIIAPLLFREGEESDITSILRNWKLILFLILVGLIFRGVTFEFRHHSHTEKGKMLWTKVLGVASFAIPFLFGLMFTSMIQGVPMDAKGNVTATFTTYVNFLSVVGGVAVMLLAWLHGLNYLALKTEGALRERAAKIANILYFVLYAGEVVFAVL